MNKIKKVLFLGDVTDTNGKKALEKYLPEVKQKYNIDLIIANGENAAPGGRGYSTQCHELFLKLGIDAITLGNHLFKNNSIMQIIGDKRIIRPANFVTEVGQGYSIIEKDNIKYAIISLMGNVNMPYQCNNAFTCAKSILKKIGDKCNFIMIDIHASDHGEKYSLAHHFNGQVTAVLGTHTHVPTNDAQILNKGTAYISDVGMCGTYSLIRGKPISQTINKYVYWKNYSDKPNFDYTMCGCIVYFDHNSSKATSIKPIIYGNTIYGAIK